ncbi:MAG TPA: ABC transporter ATP-binding protein [Capillimicrobium sp.]|nr:ABC transporter ATP-binding protein [Capillimicrobium sp.]
MLALDGISKAFGPVTAVDAASLHVGRGEFVALLGPSGCGKTTALRVVAGFERPDAGTVAIDGRTVAGPGTFVAPERRHVGMVFQDYALFPHLDVLANVGFGLTRAGREARAREVLDFVGLGDLGDRYPSELSGGQQQRVALARALAPEPALVLLDEPWNAIDPLLRAEMRTELATLLSAAGVTVVLVTHDREEAFTLADRIAVMREGRIVQVATPEELYFAPADRWTAEFVGAANILPGTRSGTVVSTPVGAFPAPATAAEGAVDVLVRPELVGLEVDANAEGEVVERTFLGHDVFYRVRLPDGTTVRSQRPSNEAVPLGARVRVTVHDGRVVTF